MIFSSKAALRAASVLAYLAAAATVEAGTLNITVKESIVTLDDANQVNYDQNQNANNAKFVFDGGAVKMQANMWKAIQLPGGGVDVNADTVLRFDFDLTDPGEIHAICLDENLELSADSTKSDFAEGKRCFILGVFQTPPSNWLYVPDLLDGNGTRSFEIPVGHYYRGTMNYLGFVQDNDIDRSVGYSEFSNIEIVDIPTETLDVQVRSQPVSIPAHPQLDYYIGNPFDQDSRFWFMKILDGGNSVQMDGNMFRALELPGGGIDINYGTVLEFDFALETKKDFHSVCLDEDTRLVKETKRCFVLANTQSGIDNQYHVPNKTAEGDTNHYKIPIGLYYGTDVTALYMAFVQDNDTSDKTTGKSTFSNFQIYDVPRPPLIANVFGADVVMPNTNIPYSSSDTLYYPLEISADGSTATMEGNTLRLVEFPAPIEITKATELNFYFTLNEMSDYHAICLRKTASDTSKRCFLLAYESSKPSNHYSTLEPLTQEGEVDVPYNIRVGLKYTGTFQYLEFVQRSAAGDKSGGSSSISDIVIEDRPPLALNVDGADVMLLNYQQTYESTGQDTVDNLMVVSEDGKSVSMTGNLWKAIKIEGGLEITDKTVLQFDFELAEETEIHEIGFEEDLDADNGARRLKLGGFQTTNLGNSVIYRNIKQTYEGESYTYMMKLSEFYTGTMNYITFVQDNDTPDRLTGGNSTFRNIKLFEPVSCLADKNFAFSVAECTVSNFVEQVRVAMSANSCAGDDPWAELFAFFDVSYEYQIREKIGDICTSAYRKNYLPFNKVTGEEYQFTAEYLDGGTVWNYGDETALDGGQPLSKEASKVQDVHDMIAANPRGIAMPDVHNFHGCELRAAMCCFVSRRDDNAVTTVTDNADACYMEFKNAQQSSHVRDGYSIYGDAAEGDLNCHGMAWGNDPGYAGSAFRGNTLFDIAMKQGLLDNGYVEELPGAPLCGCIEQMPVVTNAACTKVEATQTVAVTYTAATASFVATVDITSISHSDCGDLSAYYDSLVAEGKATDREKALLDEHLVESCDAAIGSFLESKGFQWTA